MLQLLVDRRDDLELGQIIPVGDLFDVIADGDEPVLGGDAHPLRQRQAALQAEASAASGATTWCDLGEHSYRRCRPGAKARALRNDARLIKTLLLSALVPEVDSLKALTAQRLAALNHGTIRSPIPGRETQDVLRKCRRMGCRHRRDQGHRRHQLPDLDPGHRRRHRAHRAGLPPPARQPGNRRRRVREMLFEQLGVTDTNDLFATYAVLWRGKQRGRGAVRERPRDVGRKAARAPGTWTVVIDFRSTTRSPGRRLGPSGRLSRRRHRRRWWMPSFSAPRRSVIWAVWRCWTTY